MFGESDDYYETSNSLVDFTIQGHVNCSSLQELCTALSEVVVSSPNNHNHAFASLKRFAIHSTGTPYYPQGNNTPVTDASLEMKELIEKFLSKLPSIECIDFSGELENLARIAAQYRNNNSACAAGWKNRQDVENLLKQHGLDNKLRFINLGGFESF